MKNFVKYSGDAHFNSIEFKATSASLGIMSLTTMANDAGWTLAGYLDPEVTMQYMWPPYYASETDYNLYRPFTAYCGNAVIGYYNPTEDEPPQTPGMTIFWFPAPTSASATMLHTAQNIGLLYPGFSAEVVTPLPGWQHAIRVYFFEGGPMYNNIHFAPDPAIGYGGNTTWGGHTLRSRDYNGYRVDVDFFQYVDNLYTRVRFNGDTPNYIYRLGRYTWDCFVNPYQILMYAKGSGETGDLAANSVGFGVGTPFKPSTLNLTYSGFSCGGLKTEAIYNGGDIKLRDNTVKCRINASSSQETQDYSVYDSGMQFPVMFNTQQLYVVNAGTDYPLLNPAYLSLSQIPADPTSLCRVVGNLWDAFITSVYYARGTELSLDSQTWICVASQNSSTLGQTPASLFVLKEE